ncbi:hypothetical protein OH76DRAFT_1484876 [Lentinus brumalis]|uniref:Uncharacterized protein n=1 Tax=Lentinus brumalis TaxID=2498619 RepID=A0A371D408_9APHY|nr:hypothetical protein OH76DRAFT_1484876 [Polyporus brumalis]
MFSSSQRNWSLADFETLSIDVVDRNIREFFCIKSLPGLPDAIPSAVLTEPITGHDQEFPFDRAHRFHRHLEDTIHRNGPYDINFARAFVEVFLDQVPGGGMELVRYAGPLPRRDVRSGREYPLVVNMKEKAVSSCFCILRSSTYVPGGSLFRPLMFIEVDAEQDRHRDAVPRLLASAIAGIAKENRRRRAAGVDELVAAPVLLVSFMRSAPTFHKVIVTPELIRALADGKHASSVTVERLVVPLPSPHLFEEWGMCPLDNRKVLLQCFVACTQYMDSIQLAEGGEADMICREYPLGFPSSAR